MSGADLGDVFLLQKYDKMRKSKNMAMMSSLDALHRIYGTQDSVLALVRGLGMLGLNNMALLKNSVARFAMGLEPY
jgi:2-polyprenyl-6-methoxyphenol hydroxylase-like FAD-dependent oxidoreductase